MQLAEFVRWAIERGCWEGCEVDGADIQDKAVELGILMETKYDPEFHNPPEWVDIEPGAVLYVFSEEFLTALRTPKPANDA